MFSFLFFILFFLLLVILFTFQMLPSFQVSPSEHPIPSPHPCLCESAPPPTHPLPPSHPGIPLHWGIEPPQAQGPLLPLMSNKAILCHICGRSHGSLHVYSLVGGSVPRSSQGVWPVDTVAPFMGLQTPSAPSVPFQLLHQGPCAESNG